MKFWTQSGSEYEVLGDKIRRVYGTTEATKRIGDEWRTFVSISMREGSRAMIVWPDTVEHTPGSTPMTITSRIIRVEE